MIPKLPTHPKKAEGGPKFNFSSLVPFLILYAIVIAIWATLTVIISCVAPSWETRGQVGDTFGAANALFSALAFATLIVTLRLQQRDVAAQLAEMRRSRLMDEKPLLVATPTQFATIGRFEAGQTVQGGDVKLATNTLLQLSIRNASESPAIHVQVDWEFEFGTIRIAGGDKRYSMILREGEEKFDIEFEINATQVLKIHDGLLLSTSIERPRLNVRIKYNNIGGGAFGTTHSFDVSVIDEKSEDVLKRLVASWRLKQEDRFAAKKATSAPTPSELAAEEEPGVRLKMELKHDSFQVAAISEHA